MQKDNLLGLKKYDEAKWYKSAKEAVGKKLIELLIDGKTSL